MILVATRSTSLRDGLLTLLTAIAPDRFSEPADTTTVMLDQLVEVPVELIVLDAELFGGSADSVLHQIEIRSPTTRCLILAETVVQQEDLRQLGAEEVLLKGTSATEIANAIERLLDASSTLTN